MVFQNKEGLILTPEWVEVGMGILWVIQRPHRWGATISLAIRTTECYHNTMQSTVEWGLRTFSFSPFLLSGSVPYPLWRENGDLCRNFLWAIRISISQSASHLKIQKLTLSYFPPCTRLPLALYCSSIVREMCLSTSHPYAIHRVVPLEPSHFLLLNMKYPREGTRLA